MWSAGPGRDAHRPGADHPRGVIRRQLEFAVKCRARKIIVNIADERRRLRGAAPMATSTGLTARPASRDFYGLPEFERSIDAEGPAAARRSSGASSWAPASEPGPSTTCSPGSPPPVAVPVGVDLRHRVDRRLRRRSPSAGRQARLADGRRPGSSGPSWTREAVDEVDRSTVVPTFIGEGIPLMAPRHRDVPLRVLGVRSFPDGVVQLHYRVQRSHD